jgi:hypothetical protein
MIVIVTAPAFGFGGTRGPGGTFFCCGGCEQATQQTINSERKRMCGNVTQPVRRSPRGNSPQAGLLHVPRPQDLNFSG